MFAGIVATFLYFVFTARKGHLGRETSQNKPEANNDTVKPTSQEFPIYREGNKSAYPPLINEENGIQMQEKPCQSESAA